MEMITRTVAAAMVGMQAPGETAPGHAWEPHRIGGVLRCPEAREKWPDG